MSLISRSLTARLLAAFGIMLLLLALTGGVALWQLRTADQVADTIAGNYLPSVEYLGIMATTSNSIRRYEYGHIHAEEPARKRSYEDRIAQYLSEFDAAMAKYTKMEMDGEERQSLDQVRTTWQEYVKAIARTRQLSNAGNTAEALKSLGAARNGFEEVDAAIKKLVTINMGEADAARTKQDQAVEHGYLITTVVAVGSLLIGVFLAIYLARRIVAPVTEVRRVLEALAKGDLTQRPAIKGQDEVAAMAAALARTLDGLNRTVGGISGNAQGLAGASEELTAVSKQLSDSATTVSNQAGTAAAAANQVSHSANTVSVGVEEMGSSVAEIAQNAGQAATVAKEGVDAATEADAAMTRLGRSSDEIGNIIKVINAIAEQTNLLALNATIEAARAGEAGRGFAVVASEVKNLANQTAEATSDVAQRITAIQTDSRAASAALTRIRAIVVKINDFQQSIASAVEEQSATTRELGGNIGQVAKGSTEIAQSIERVATAAQQSSTGAGETLKSAQELARLAEELRQAVAGFKTA